MFEAQLRTGEIRIRDPFIYADEQSKTYFMYAQSANRADSGFIGVEAYMSEDLQTWSNPRPVLELPNNAGIEAVWAPEMHQYNDKFYLFVTLTFKDTLPEAKPGTTESWPPMKVRGTHIFYADNPLGPFKPFKKTSHTPSDWMALDGTLFVDDGVPYMVFCHEWVQTVDGTMDLVRLKNDLSSTVGKPKLLFKASAAPGAYADPKIGKVTDGCFLYRSPKSEKLFMIWSTFIPGKDYCVVLTQSDSGKMNGPWSKQEIVYSLNGGHGMMFKSFDGLLMMALHQPNSSPQERLHLFQISDNGETLAMTGHVVQ